MTKTKKKKHRISNAGKKSLIKFSMIRNNTRGLAKRDNRYIISFFIMLFMTLLLLSYTLGVIFDEKWVHNELFQNVENKYGHDSIINFTFSSENGKAISMTIFLSILTWSKASFNTTTEWFDHDSQIHHDHGTYQLMDGVVYFQIMFILSIIITVLMFYFWFTGKNKSLFFNTKLNWHIFVAIFAGFNMVSFAALTSNPLDTGWAEFKDLFHWDKYSTTAPGTIMQLIFTYISFIPFIVSFSLWFYNVRHIDPDADPIKFVKVGGKAVYKTGSTVVKLIVKAIKGVIRVFSGIGWL